MVLLFPEQQPNEVLLSDSSLSNLWHAGVYYLLLPDYN